MLEERLIVNQHKFIETVSEGLVFLFMVQFLSLEINYQIHFKSNLKQYWAQIII